MSKKKAFITGITGQDGSYLAEFLLEKNYHVIGLVRQVSNWNLGNIEHLLSKITLVSGDILDNISLQTAFRKHQPDEVYNLAAQTHVGESWVTPISTSEITGLGALRVFDAVRQACPKAKVYQASSSEMFGKPLEVPQNEKTPLAPVNPYAVCKTYAHHMAGIYRDSYNLFIARGILFNHESPRRGTNFVTQKVAHAAACAKLGIKSSPILNEKKDPIFRNKKVALGNLNAKRDWGFAGDSIEAMWLMLQQKKPGDFIIATGKTRTVQELCKTAFSCVDLNWKDYVLVDRYFVRPIETGPLVGDYSKAHRILGWQPKTSFQDLVQMMVNAQITKLQKYVK